MPLRITLLLTLAVAAAPSAKCSPLSESLGFSEAELERRVHLSIRLIGVAVDETAAMFQSLWLIGDRSERDLYRWKIRAIATELYYTVTLPGWVIP